MGLFPRRQTPENPKKQRSSSNHHHNTSSEAKKQVMHRELAFIATSFCLSAWTDFHCLLFLVRIPALRQAQQPPHVSHNSVTESPASVQTCRVMKNLCLQCPWPALELRGCERREEQIMARNIARSCPFWRSASCSMTQPNGTWRTFMSLSAHYQVVCGTLEKCEVSVQTFNVEQKGTDQFTNLSQKCH